MICKPCATRADANNGCDVPCAEGCDCQHRPLRLRGVESTKALDTPGPVPQDGGTTTDSTKETA